MIITSSKPATLAIHKRITKLMGNRFEISVVADDKLHAETSIDAAIEEISRIESRFTTFKETSETNLVNRHAGVEPVQVSREFIQLVQRSNRISALTQGAFDITYGSIDRSLWNFNTQMTSLPDAETCRKLIRLIDYRKVIVDEEKNTVMLAEAGMRLGFGGIGKGYAADRAKLVLKERGIVSGVVNAAGDLTTWGHQPDGKPWTIGIANPEAVHHPFSFLDITNMAIATSGNYEKFVMIDGIKYSHTIDPRTGLPVGGIKSVTIITSHAELADAMATPVMIMGIKAGLHMINQVKGIAAVIIDDNNRLFTSKNITLK